MTPKAILHDSHIGRWRTFSEPVEVLESTDINQVLPILAQVEKQIGDGLWAVGFISYEASAAFEISATTRSEEDFPKIWFALFQNSSLIDLPRSQGNFYLGEWRPELDSEKYYQAVSKVKEYIKRGDTYQTNFTFRQSARFAGDPFECFLSFIEHQSTPYGAFISCDEFSICSASPELFFTKDGTKIITKPMKGTAPRKLEDDEDQKQPDYLKLSSKERSENVMIVDMIRNDLSRIAADASVKPLSLFDVEKFETLWQMTSTIEAYSDKSASEILTALFPCASITGAPKCSTMKIISELEISPRKLYTGAIGLLSPKMMEQTQFSVAIRTLLIDHRQKDASYGVGSGVVWDSDSAQEYCECLLKSEATPNYPLNLELLETILWSEDKGFVLLDSHLERMQNSASFFGFNFEFSKIQNYLRDISIGWKSKIRVRLLVSGDGGIRHEAFDFTPSSRLLKLALAKSAINSKNIYLLHKTTERSIYNAALNALPEYDDVILYNENNEVTETCIGNIAYRRADIWYTPPLSCGLLNGVLRQQLLAEGKLQEGILLVEELSRIDEIALINSVRGWCSATFDSASTRLSA